MGKTLVKLLFLRGQVPTDRSPKQIMFDDIMKCDDVWTQIAYHLSLGGYGEVWYWGGKRITEYKDNFVERWVKDFRNHIPSFTPDVIFCRGGFPQYDSVLQRFPKAFKIYYGAGRRFMPQSAFKKYNLILVDTPKQLAVVKKTFPKARAELFIKPAADNVFKPVEDSKSYDVIFSSNEHKGGIKGHDFILPAFPDDLRMIQTGITSQKQQKKFKNIEFTGWIPRRKLPELYAKCKIAVVCCTNVDSCPRIIPEALACNCPLLVLDTVNFWQEKYINVQTGKVATKSDFIKTMRKMILHYADFSPYNYYKENLSLDVSASYIKNLISR